MILAHDHVTTAGPDKPTLVFIHAFPMNRRMWDAQAEGLARQANMVLLDSRGFGQSAAAGDAERQGWGVELWASDVLETLDHLRVGRAAFAGCSMGGYIIFELLRRVPERVAGVALVDTRPEPDTPEAKQVRAGQIARVREEGNGVMVDWALEKLLCEGTHKARPDVVAKVRAIASSTPAETLVGALAALAERPDSRPVLGTIRVPATVIVGTHDVVTPPEISQAMATAIPGAQLVEVPAAGHLTPMENPAAVNEALAVLLRAV